MKRHTLIEMLVPTLYEDEHLLAVDKPAGVDAGGTRSEASGGLAELLTELRGGGEKLIPANRLSRYESGVLLLGKNSEVVRHIRSALKSLRITQEYVAVVRGRPVRQKMILDPDRAVSKNASRVRAAGTGKHGAKRNARARSTAEADGGRVRGQPTVLMAVRAGERRTLVRCRTRVGTTHALRAQLRAARLRLLGDTLHDQSKRPIPKESTCLHLETVSFRLPNVKSTVRVTCKAPPGFVNALDARTDPVRMLRAGLTRRLPCLLDTGTNAYRLLSGNVEGVKGLVAERYGEAVVLQVEAQRVALAEAVDDIARWYHKTLGVRAVYTKPSTRGRTNADSRVSEKDRSAVLLAGKPVPSSIQILERGLRFEIRPFDGPSVGLFLDQRENRSRLRSMASGKDVLNLFAYTCGFSVAAAAGKAHSTVSVDISPVHLEWGRTNFALNGLDAEGHQFIRSDAFDYLKRAKRQEKRFDIIVLDPPTFAHARRSKRTFSTARDLPAVVSDASAVLRPNGIMMFSTNYRRLSMRAIQELISAGAGERSYRILSTPSLPPDFAIDRDHAKTLFVRFV